MDSPMRHARGNFACATLSSQLYAIGGTGTDAVMADVEVLDIRKMQWQSVAPLSAPRTFGSAVALDNTVRPADALTQYTILVTVKSHSLLADCGAPTFGLPIMLNLQPSSMQCTACYIS